MGLPPGDTKEGPLRRVISVLEEEHTPHALIEVRFASGSSTVARIVPS